MNPPKGYYRQLVGGYFPEIRIAFISTPIIGCTKVDNTNVLKVLEASDDPHAQFYIDGLRDGRLVTIVENGQEYVYKNNGELYFKS
jgi:hypothetical protein